MTEATQFNQLMPIAGVAGQARGFQHQHHPNLTEADLCDQTLKAGACRGTAA
jgi:hypothetical protein